jgi:hypothetical protein
MWTNVTRTNRATMAIDGATPLLALTIEMALNGKDFTNTFPERTFHFDDAMRLIDMHPRQGPVLGGTVVTIDLIPGKQC